MDDERFADLLAACPIPAVPEDLDRRVLRDGGRILEGAGMRGAVEDVGRTVLERLGFGYVTWLVDAVTTTDAEYRVEFL